MELLQLRYFKAAAELENFSLVAEKYMVPQPSISKTIKKLENELGVQLFDRIGKRIALNGNGKVFYDKISDALNSIDEGVEHLTNSQTNIVIYRQAGGRLALLLIADYMTSNNNVYISSVGYSSELQNNYDFTFMQPNDQLEHMNYVKLMDDEIICVASKDHPITKRKGPISIKDLKDENFIGHYKSMNIRQSTDEYCKKEGGFTPHYVYETNDYLAIRYLVAKNKGVALLPKVFYELQHVDQTKTVLLKEKAHRTLLLAWNKNKVLSETEKDFINYAKKWFKNIGPNMIH